MAASVARGALALCTNFTRQVAFVRKIPWTATVNELRKHFAQFGHIQKCILPFDKETGFHKGMCWIYFSSEEALQNAVQHENHVIDGVKATFKFKNQTFCKGIKHLMKRKISEMIKPIK